MYLFLACLLFLFTVDVMMQVSNVENVTELIEHPRYVCQFTFVSARKRDLLENLILEMADISRKMYVLNHVMVHASYENKSYMEQIIEQMNDFRIFIHEELDLEKNRIYPDRTLDDFFVRNKPFYSVSDVKEHLRRLEVWNGDIEKDVVHNIPNNHLML